MAESLHLADHVPVSCRDLLEKEDLDLKTAIPELARDKGRMGEIEKVVKSLPSHHELYQGDSHDLSMILGK